VGRGAGAEHRDPAPLGDGHGAGGLRCFFRQASHRGEAVLIADELDAQRPREPDAEIALERRHRLRGDLGEERGEGAVVLVLEPDVHAPLVVLVPLGRRGDPGAAAGDLAERGGPVLPRGSMSLEERHGPIAVALVDREQGQLRGHHGVVGRRAVERCVGLGDVELHDRVVATLQAYDVERRGGLGARCDGEERAGREQRDQRERGQRPRSGAAGRAAGAHRSSLSA
jgi:hypothetical protein